MRNLKRADWEICDHLCTAFKNNNAYKMPLIFAYKGWEKHYEKTLDELNDIKFMDILFREIKLLGLKEFNFYSANSKAEYLELKYEKNYIKAQYHLSAYMLTKDSTFEVPLDLTKANNTYKDIISISSLTLKFTEGTTLAEMASGITVKNYLDLLPFGSQKTLKEQFIEVAKNLLKELINLLYVARTTNKFAVIKKKNKDKKILPPKAKKKKQNEEASIYAPRIVFLNKWSELPEYKPKKEHQGGTHASPKPHNRRGHYKTLKHERYRHNPLFEVENGIYVEPVWVGDKSKTINGTTYTVV